MLELELPLTLELDLADLSGEGAAEESRSIREGENYLFQLQVGRGEGEQRAAYLDRSGWLGLEDLLLGSLGGLLCTHFVLSLLSIIGEGDVYDSS